MPPPPATNTDLYLQEVSEIPLVRGFDLNRDDHLLRGMSDDKAKKAYSQFDLLLREARITENFKDRLREMMAEACWNAMIQTAGPVYLKGLCGVDPDRGEYGIFDSNQAKVFEAGQIGWHMFNPPIEYAFKEDGYDEYLSTIMKPWFDAYKRLHGADPRDVLNQAGRT